MKLTSADIYPVPAPTAYARLADFDALEALIESHGGKILNRGAGWPDGQGRSWRVAVGFKGVHRELDACVTAVDAPRGYAITGVSDGITCQLGLTVTPAGEDAARVSYAAELGAKGLAGRLVLQPLRLAQATLDAKFHARVQALVRNRLGI